MDAKDMDLDCLVCAIRTKVCSHICWADSLDDWDLIQSSLLEVLESQCLADKSPDEQVKIIVRVAQRQLCASRRRRLRRKRDASKNRPLGKRDFASRIEGPEVDIDKHDLVEYVLSQLGDLPVAQRDMVQLYYVEALSLTEIARRRGCSKPSVSRMLHRGIEKLKSLNAGQVGSEAVAR